MGLPEWIALAIFTIGGVAAILRWIFNRTIGQVDELQDDVHADNGPVETLRRKVEALTVELGQAIKRRDLDEALDRHAQAIEQLRNARDERILSEIKLVRESVSSLQSRLDQLPHGRRRPR